MSAVRGVAAPRATALPRLRGLALPQVCEAALAALLGLLCVGGRLIHIDRYTGSYAEGVRAEQLLLMAAGFRPFEDIFSDQGPWLLHAFYPGYVLLGGSLVGVRAASIVGSLIGLAAIYWVLRQVAGPAGGLASLALLGLSPLYLRLSRVAVAELVALAPAILAVGCAIRFAQRPTMAWLYAAAALLAVSVLIKPITLGVALPVAVAVWTVRVGRWRNLLLLGLIAGVVGFVGLLLVGLPAVMQQIVQFRLASRRDAGWRLATNLSELQGQLSEEGFILLALAVVGAVLAARRRATWPLLVWALAAAATIIFHAPLHTKHFSIVVVPIAALAGYAVGSAISWASGLRHRGRALAAVGLVLLALGVIDVPPLLARDWHIITTENSSRDRSFRWYGDGAESLRRVVGPSEYLVTDHSYLAYAANRLVPPSMVEASATRVQAGSLTDAMAIQTTERYQARAVLLWAAKLDDLRRYRAWLKEHYVPVRLWAAEDDTRPVLWLRADGPLASARDALRAGLTPAPLSEASGGWRIISYGLDRSTVRPDETISVTLEWEQVEQLTLDAKVSLSLVDASGRKIDDEREPFLAGAPGARWLFWVAALPVPAKTPSGEYRLQASLVDSRGRPLGQPVGLTSVNVRH
jgi:Dolichyl-phosphate-mannose-protein mannosyltransferase